MGVRTERTLRNASPRRHRLLSMILIASLLAANILLAGLFSLIALASV